MAAYVTTKANTQDGYRRRPRCVFRACRGVGADAGNVSFLFGPLLARIPHNTAQTGAEHFDRYATRLKVSITSARLNLKLRPMRIGFRTPEATMRSMLLRLQRRYRLNSSVETISTGARRRLWTAAWVTEFIGGIP